eukprot:CAMPEP_0179913014 /NCGR_PEP_ID=MMETSP0983-20121128/221_1 /TAXON_ID=483367 /ORGANISM="non described non described, Strain CCMP 2436" /LENGTH=230 /DNA_ID=CAMNT_0021814949 /DNA_START=60 /DNA_END=751 /DNA_ORIENTATION=+
MSLGAAGAQGGPLGQLLVRAAARVDLRDAAAILASHGVELEAADANGMTALHHAATAGAAALVSLILAAGAQPSPLSRTGACTPLHLAARAAEGAEVVHLLLTYGADPRERDHRQQTPLHVAAKFANLGAARALLNDPRCDPTLLDVDGKAALQWATQLGHAEVARMIPGDHRMTTIKMLRLKILSERKAEAELLGGSKSGKGRSAPAKSGKAAAGAGAKPGTPRQAAVH